MPTTSPRTDALIHAVMRQHPGASPSASARYYEAVHQELAPFTRALEAQVADMAMLIKQLSQALNQATPNHAAAKHAMDYLQRNGLAGSSLRDTRQ